MNRQAILDVLNNLKVIEKQGGDDSYILVENNAENRRKLAAVGVYAETIRKYGDSEDFCILALAFNEKYADYTTEDGKLMLVED